MFRRIFLPLFTLGILTALPSSAAITGTVMTSDGLPVAGARIELFKPESSDAHVRRLLSKAPGRVAIVSAESDAKGNFTLDPGKEPVVDLRVEAKGYAPAGLRLAGDEEAGAIALEAAILRKGTVTSGGNPVAGAVVIWSSPGGLESISTTAADGSYSVPDPDVWAGRSVVIHPDYAIAETDAPFGPTKRKLNLTVSAGSSVSGKAVTADGKTGVATATIAIDEWPLAVSADDGSFTVKHAPAEWHTLSAAGVGLSGMRARSGDGSISVRTTKPASLSGVVRDAKTQQPIAGAEVRLGQSRLTSGETVFSDAKGNYAFASAPAGSQPVQVVRPNYGTANSTVALVEGRSVAKGLFVAPNARVVGMVQDEEKRPVAAARISARGTSRNGMFQGGGGMRFAQQAHYSGPDGRFVLRGVQPDTDVQVEALKAGFPSASSSTLKLVAGERKSGVTITIPRGVSLTGRVTDHDGKPVSGVAVTTNDAEANGGGRGGIRRMVMNGLRQRGDDAVKSASDGTFTVHLKPGLYDLSFKREGFAAKNVRGIQVNATSKPVVVKLDPGVELSGRVTRGGVGVAGVNVNIVGEGGLSATVTAADGSFSIGDLTPGQVMLNIRKQDDFIQQMRSTSVPARDLRIDLPAGGRITGHVVDKSTRQPITAFDAGISDTRSVGGMAFGMPPSLKSFTSDDGTFVLENVPPGNVQLVANAPGYVGAKIGSMTVEDGKTIADVEMALESGVKLSGHVTGPDGSPIAGVSVRPDSSGGGRGGGMFNPSFGMTDPNGDYSIDDLESGDKSFTFNKAGYLPAQKTITLSGKTASLDAQLSAGLTATGMVVTDAGVPMPDAAVRAISAAEGMGGRGASTDANGEFHIDGLAPGHYAFHASKSGFADGQVNDFDISAGAPVRVVLKTGGVIFGQVTGLTADQAGAATVSATSSSGNASAAVDSSGSYRLEGAPTGTVRVSAAINGRIFSDSKSTPAKSVQVDSGASVQVDLDFSNDIVISGRVTRQGQPVAGNIVAFVPRAGRVDARVQTTTDSNGAYSASGVTVGSYAVTVVDIQRLAPYTTSYDVKSSATFDIDMTTASVRGRVVDSATGEGIPDVNVAVKGTDGGPLATRAAISDPTGGFVLDSVAPGSYTISASKDSYAKDVENLVVGNSTPDDVTLKLTSSSGVTLTVVDGRDGSQLSATAHVVDSQGRDVSGDLSRFGSSAGPLQLPLAAGTYQVTVFATGYAPQVFTIASPSSRRVALTPGGTLQIHSQSGQPLRARLVANGAVYLLSPFSAGLGFILDPKPGMTTIRNIAAGSYTIQVLNGGSVVNSVTVTITEGGIIDVNV